jgi:hypothetical protein
VIESSSPADIPTDQLKGRIANVQALIEGFINAAKKNSDPGLQSTIRWWQERLALLQAEAEHRRPKEDPEAA